MNKKELLRAAKTLGITSVSAKNNEDEIREAINAKLGNPAPDADLSGEQRAEITDSYAAIVNEAGPESVASEGAVMPTLRDIPNLSPNGKWQGKRARIRRTKTGHQDMGGALMRWNGWPTIIPLDVVVDIAWPIFIALKAAVGLNLEVTQEADPTNKARIHNIMKESRYDKYPHQYMGVTPGTENLPESAWEYTLDQYVDGFPGYTVRMWRQLSVLWEITDVESGIKPGMGHEAEIITRKNSIHSKLNLPFTDDKAMLLRIRNERRSDIGMEAKAA